jgi:hypothetical protein
VTARAEISRLLAIFNDLSETDKDIVLKISETVIGPKIILYVQPQSGDYAGTCSKHSNKGKHEPTL